MEKGGEVGLKISAHKIYKFLETTNIEEVKLIYNYQVVMLV